ncbi:3-keto-5-aminohexanoate cleavage protein [Thioclava sp. F34-6]|uniref:bifunctional sugar phosphate isomerase/epimerase/4-hydroxyphenylpyruvate dioxygenase family protein n=1 Tax=Thioclava sp. F34-6 TaxID=1973003 RepID=UPI000B544F27|nr:sugar phosphate isomerase/epimerase and 4-hydroxyphenylpyruvate domain-containing protein [Thioclava sp. F34-6]OWY09327.1 3-keto-5-aminohexanoate cleavage protein [Thioclava sp. F34-6]
MKTAIATVSISGTLQEKLEAIAAAGFDGIEIFEQDFIAHDGGPREVGQMVRDHGLEIFLFQPFRDFEGLPAPLRHRALKRAEHKFELMRELGTRDMLVCSSVHPEALGGIDRMAGDFAALGELAADYDIRVGFEALAWGRHVWDHRDAWEVVRRADHPNVGLILDSFHSLARKIEPDTIRRIPGDKIFYVQLADAPAIDMDLLYWSRHFRNMPGEGDLDVTGFMRAVMATGYDGPASLEIFNDQFRGGPTRTIARDGYRSLVALMDDVRRTEPGLEDKISEIPARVAVDGVEFIEFAAQGVEAETLKTLLSTLGFHMSGRHRNKKLEVWRQGDIRILINAETTGFAASTWTARGTNVCDIGLKVADAAATVTRARALGAKTFSQPIGPGELEIPAIRGLGGSVLHFVDGSSGLNDVWDVEFEPAEETSQCEAGLISIDHLAQTMEYDEMLSWTLFYTTLFDMQKAPMVDVIDPDGLVRSQAIASRGSGNGKGLQVTLNGAETHRTLAGDFLTHGFGASVQHIALRTTDMLKTAASLADLGFDPLPMPSNYYADLEARFELSREFVQKLQSANILYDEDAQGAFHQLYSRPFAGGMFFEILERRNGYEGFGAANAPFRIAAQKRFGRVKGMPDL